MNFTFERWLMNQQHRNDLVGELARIPDLQKPEFKTSRRKSDEHKTWATLVINNISPGYIEVFNEAWQEFLLAKQAAKSSLE